ncbi:hypothetical protein RR48_09371 [Papilio machaon]|uniref:Uncharacterized protein n=1 Tax=Papilio machaon TaxID=76193 RepID=A0A194RCU2_PAPMA|nr:hypothetical protein RR48_09371 [Papilio machaon]
MAHESAGGAGGGAGAASPHAASPPHAPRLPHDTSFHHQIMQEFLKKKAAANANGTVPGSPYRNWGIVKSSSGESITSTGATATAHPYRLAAPPALALNAAPPQPSPSDYPLRKTGE